MNPIDAHVTWNTFNKVDLKYVILHSKLGKIPSTLASMYYQSHLN